jgi:hypothetical protein
VRHACVLAFRRPDHVLVGAKAVVVDRLRPAVPVDIEELPDMGEAVPLGRVLQVQDDEVVADHVGRVGDLLAEAEVEVRPRAPERRADHRRVAARVQDIAAGTFERQRQAEGQPLAHLGHALAHLLRREEVEAAELVVRAEIAPGRSMRSALPARVRHARLSH